jgi:hypothetical protein
MKSILKYCFVAFIFMSQITAFADTKPRKINATKSGKGVDGYDQVDQKWTGEDSGDLTCKNAGNLTCEWLSINTGAGSWNVNEAFDQIMMGSANSGEIVHNGVTIAFTVIERLPDNQGTIEFIIYE